MSERAERRRHRYWSPRLTGWVASMACLFVDCGRGWTDDVHWSDVDHPYVPTPAEPRVAAKGEVPRVEPWGPCGWSVESAQSDGEVMICGAAVEAALHAPAHERGEYWPGLSSRGGRTGMARGAFTGAPDEWAPRE